MNVACSMASKREARLLPMLLIIRSQENSCHSELSTFDPKSEWVQVANRCTSDLILRIIQENYIPGLELYWPKGLDEMRGVADGAGLPLEDIIMLNSRYDLSHFEEPAEYRENGNGHAASPPAAECTSSIILAEGMGDGSVVTAQNWDMSSRLVSEDTAVYLEVHADSSENLPSMFLLAEAGQLCRSGINSAGLGLTCNSLQTSIDYCPLALSTGTNGALKGVPIPPCTALRRLFLEQRNFSDGLKCIARTPRHVSFNLMVSTAENFGMCLEVTPEKIYQQTLSSVASEPYLLHSNHFQTTSFVNQSQVLDLYSGGSSWYRPERLEVGLKRKAQRSALTENDIINAFSDHFSFPHSLCEHDLGNKPVAKIPGVTANDPSALRRNAFPDPTSTVACAIYNLSQKTVKVCKGPPCQGTFQEFKLQEI